MSPLRLSLVALALCPEASAQTFFGPTPYLSTADIPAGFHSGPFVVEDFEDGFLAHGVTAPGNIVVPGSITDSVDADDGVIDGSGTDGHSWFAFGPMTITFPAPVTRAGLVWTDGPAFTEVTFEAVGPGMVSLGMIGPFMHADGSISGTTAEDRFYGVQYAGGIEAIVLRSISGNQSIEVDHLQFDTPAGTYCAPAVSNSTGAPGVITAFGSSVAADNDLLLVASQLPSAQFGYFLASQDQGLFMPPVSQGFICLSGSIGRLNAPGQVFTGPTGAVQLDLTTIPVNPPQAVQPGDTWNFQAWYRDVGNTNNFTDAVSLPFN